MEFEKIKELMENVNSSKINNFELKMPNGFYIKMNKLDAIITENINIKNNIQNKEIEINTNTQNEMNEHTKVVIDKMDTINKEQEKEVTKIMEITGEIVKAPIVGTFYESSTPKKQAYVKIGDKIKKGDVLCIIEAMKVMNDVVSSYDGTVAEIFVKNEEMVEYGSSLFKII